MECPNCKFVAAPGEAAVEGICPNCNRPYRDQPTPLNSDMAVRDMPEPGMEDSGGNPLQEGILGDYQNRGVRDQSFASVRKGENIYCPHCRTPELTRSTAFEEGVERNQCLNCGYHDEHPINPRPEFQVTDVTPPDPESIRPDKKQMDKQADFLDTLGDIGEVAAPVAGGTAGFLVGGPAGAAVGAGLAGGGMKALNGGDVGEVAETGLTDAALGGLGGLGGAALKAGTAADAAAAGTTRGGVGSLMKSAWSKGKNAYLMHSLLNDASQATAPSPQMMAPAAPAPAAMPPSYYSRTADTGSSSDHVPSNNTDDPEQVDYHEKNDGEKDGLQSDPAVNGVGGTDLGPDDFFAPDSGALAAFAELLPKILQYATSDQSAAGDPEMEDLHSKLEAEKPGYMNNADDDHGQKLVVMLMKGDPNGNGDSDDLLQDNDIPHDPIAEHEASALRPGLETTCPRCGGVMDASTGSCPQCGKENGDHQPQPTNPDFTTPQQMMNPPAENQLPAVQGASAGTQGPNTDEQKAAVAELLQEEGRQEEIPTMIMEPWNYADELTKITGGEEPPEDIGQAGPPPPVVAPQEGEMPVPGMAPPGGAGGPQMMAAVAKYAGTVDGICESCPKCGSHSTGYTDYEEGDAGCKACGYHWKAKPLVKQGAPVMTPPELNTQGVPDLEGQGSEDMEEADPQGSHSWVDQTGEPLQVGQTYEMYSENYDIPDRVRIDAVKPDVVEYTMVGEYGLDHRTELTHEEAQLENLSFVPADIEGEVDSSPETQNMEDIARPEPGQETDASTPHEMLSRTADFDDINGPNGPNVDSTAPCPRCEGEGVINRQIGKYAPGNPEDAERCPDCSGTGYVGSGEFTHADPLEGMYHAPSANHPLGPQTGSVQEETGPDWLMHDNGQPETHEASSQYQEGEDTGPGWLMAGVAPSGGRTAGAKMTPWEQRDYIDEVGDARNSDKLQLSGTHYEMDDLTDQFLFGL